MTHRYLTTIKLNVRYFRRIVSDARTPRVSRFLLICALAYLASPIDLIPDVIPVLGQLDDLLVVPTLIWIALLLVPSVVKTDARAVAATAT